MAIEKLNEPTDPAYADWQQTPPSLVDLEVGIPTSGVPCGADPLVHFPPSSLAEAGNGGRDPGVPQG